MNNNIRTAKRVFFLLFVIGVFGCGAKSAMAQESPGVLYIPLIGITSVPDPLALPAGGGDVTYQYAVKNFVAEAALTDVHVVDETCGSVAFVEGDDNSDAKLDASETWRFACRTKISETTQNTATVTGSANGIVATHQAFSTVVVGSDAPPPLVSVINITKVAYPLSLPSEGGEITFTYKVSNPGVVSLQNVTVSDDKCAAMSGRLGDTNGNALLDVNEVWIYTCTTSLKRTSTNTVTVAAFANGLKAVSHATLTVKVETPTSDLPVQDVPGFPETGPSFNIKHAVWEILSGVLAILLLFFFFARKHGFEKMWKKFKPLVKTLLIIVLLAGAVGAGTHFLLTSRLGADGSVNTGPDTFFGWKYPVAKFPTTGLNEIAYSDIRDPGGIPQGLPVRLKIPVIGVDSAIEDALITPDGRMDVPSGSVNVAWFSLGPHPGQEGSAVIGGHFGISDGVPFVFYNLDKLKVGDKVYILNDKGETLGFVVRSIALFDRNADATPVFTSGDGLAHLNLITCEGIWNQSNGLYPERRVVFTDALPAGDVVETGTAFHRSLGLGAQGADVVELQTTLVQKGFLVMPRGVAKGYYGALTRAAVTKYQKSVGLPMNGIFGPSTRTALIPRTGIASALPAAGTDQDAPTPLAAKEPEISKSVRSSILLALYATPVDGFITTLFLLSIVFVLFQGIRRRRIGTVE